MLSIGAMGGGQAGYYVGLAREDYYHGGGEPPGRWHGQGARDLSLVGVVDSDALHQLFAGFHPTADRALIQNAGAKDHQPGWDLTFSAPKSVSALWSQADSETRRVIQDAHHDAVKAALSYIEAEAAITRRGKGGNIKEAAHLVVATFEHGTSRAQDPQLHTHCLLINVCTRADGTSGTMESKPLYQAKMTAGALYRAEFATLLEQRLDLTAIRKGSCFEVEGVPQKLMTEFSKRRAEIEQVLYEKGYHSAEAAAAATLSTRQVKGHVAREELFEAWQETGERLGWGPEEATMFLHDAHAPQRNVEMEKAEALQVTTAKITEQQSYFTGRDFIRHLAEEAQGRGFGATTVLTAGNAHLAESREIVALGQHKGEAVYFTREMVALEKKLLTQIDASRDKVSPGVSETVLAGVLSSRQKLSEEQVAALRHVCEAGPGSIRLVSDMAGTGKTSLLDAARFAWTLEGFEVHGAALSDKAAKGLQDGALIPSKMLDKTLRSIEAGTLKLHARSVLVVDEADRLDTRPMQNLVALTQNANARLVLVESATQLQATLAVGPFQAMETRLGAANLSGLAAYAQRGLLSVAGDKRKACEALISTWKAEGIYAPETQRIFADTPQDAAALNRLAQEERKKAGVLSSAVLTSIQGGDAFHAGDRVLFTRKSRIYGVENGSLGDVIVVDNDKRTLLVRLDGGDKATIPLDCFPHVRLGYALTSYKGKEQTDRPTFVLAGKETQGREMAFMQAVPTYNGTHIFADTATVGVKLTRLARQAVNSHEQKMVPVVQEQGPSFVHEAGSLQL